MVRKIAFVVVAAFLFHSGVLGTRSARADEAVLEQLLGDGMHAYFGGDFTSAYNILSAAAHDGSRDPRVYYYRGLADLRLGREPDAGADFEKGATLEASDSNGQYHVGLSLERIQGPARQSIEQYRERARVVAFQRAQDQQRRVFAEQGSRGPILLRHDVEMVPAPAASTAEAPAKPGWQRLRPAGPPAIAPPAARGQQRPDTVAEASGRRRSVRRARRQNPAEVARRPRRGRCSSCSSSDDPRRHTSGWTCGSSRSSGSRGRDSGGRSPSR